MGEQHVLQQLYFLTHISRASFHGTYANGIAPDVDAAERGVPSGAILFA